MREAEVARSRLERTQTIEGRQSMTHLAPRTFSRDWLIVMHQIFWVNRSI
jgi:hypothetical protein